jgi:hypothetical protein
MKDSGNLNLNFGHNRIQLGFPEAPHEFEADLHDEYDFRAAPDVHVAAASDEDSAFLSFVSTSGERKVVRVSLPEGADLGIRSWSSGQIHHEGNHYRLESKNCQLSSTGKELLIDLQHGGTGSVRLSSANEPFHILSGGTTYDAHGTAYGNVTGLDWTHVVAGNFIIVNIVMVGSVNPIASITCDGTPMTLSPAGYSVATFGSTNIVTAQYYLTNPGVGTLPMSVTFNAMTEASLVSVSTSGANTLLASGISGGSTAEAILDITAPASSLEVYVIGTDLLGPETVVPPSTLVFNPAYGAQNFTYYSAGTGADQTSVTFSGPQEPGWGIAGMVIGGTTTTTAPTTTSVTVIDKFYVAPNGRIPEWSIGVFDDSSFARPRPIRLGVPVISTVPTNGPNLTVADTDTIQTGVGTPSRIMYFRIVSSEAVPPAISPQLLIYLPNGLDTVSTPVVVPMQHVSDDTINGRTVYSASYEFHVEDAVNYVDGFTYLSVEVPLVVRRTLPLEINVGLNGTSPFATFDDPTLY